MLNPSETDNLIGDNFQNYATRDSFIISDNSTRLSNAVPSHYNHDPRPTTPTLWSKKKVFTVKTSAVFLTLLLIWLTLSGEKNDFTAIGNWLTKMLGLDSIKDWEANGLLAGVAAGTSMVFGGAATGIQLWREQPSDVQRQAEIDRANAEAMRETPDLLFGTINDNSHEMSVPPSNQQSRFGSSV